MQEIDLGSEIQIKVKYAGTDYSLREPTVGEIDAFREKGTDGASIMVLVDLLEKLGMPRDVVVKMGMSKVTSLVDGIMDLLTKKK